MALLTQSQSEFQGIVFLCSEIWTELLTLEAVHCTVLYSTVAVELVPRDKLTRTATDAYVSDSLLMIIHAKNKDWRNQLEHASLSLPLF
jgi:hypothetical protein